MEERLHGGNQISDKFVVVDFERAIHNALLEIFLDTTLYGCVWHFKHSLTQKVAKLAIKRLYNQSKEFKKLVSMIGALVWCPRPTSPATGRQSRTSVLASCMRCPGCPTTSASLCGLPTRRGSGSFWPTSRKPGSAMLLPELTCCSLPQCGAGTELSWTAPYQAPRVVAKLTTMLSEG